MAGALEYGSLSLPKLLEKATRHFNAYIRLRDANKPCISCGKYKTLQAGHFYSAGQYSALRYNEDNVHGQCMQCNYHLHGNLIEYQKTLRHRIGNARVDALHIRAGYYKRTGYKWDRFFLEDVIRIAKVKIKLLK